MSRRAKLILLIIVAVILLGIGLWLLLSPFLGTPEQPPALPDQTTPTYTPTETIPSVQTTTPRVSLDIKQLEDQAVIFVTRIGSGSNSDGFRGYEDVLLNATPSFQQYLRETQKQLQDQHPIQNGFFGVTTRVVSVDRSQAESGANTILFILQAQRAEDAGNPGTPTSVTYQEVGVRFQKQADESYLVDEIVWKDIEI